MDALVPASKRLVTPEIEEANDGAPVIDASFAVHERAAADPSGPAETAMTTNATVP